jgi:hypothetical protein
MANGSKNELEANQWYYRPKNIAEFFFADASGEMPNDLDMKEIDLIYNDYIRVMTLMHEKLRSTYNLYV